MSDDFAKHYELEWLQDQIYDLQSTVRDLETKVDQLQMENTLLYKDLNTIKNEGCWRFIENAKHEHKKD